MSVVEIVVSVVESIIWLFFAMMVARETKGDRYFKMFMIIALFLVAMTWSITMYSSEILIFVWGILSAVACLSMIPDKYYAHIA